MTPELEDLRDAMALSISDACLTHGEAEESADALLAPDGPIMEFFGPALRALGVAALKYASGTSLDERDVALKWLSAMASITGPLADLCLKLEGRTA